MATSSCYVASWRNQEWLGLRPKQEELWYHHFMSHLSVTRNGWNRDPKGEIVQGNIMLCRISAYQERLGLRLLQEELWHHYVMSHLSVIKNGWD